VVEVKRERGRGGEDEWLFDRLLGRCIVLNRGRSLARSRECRTVVLCCTTGTYTLAIRWSGFSGDLFGDVSLIWSFGYSASSHGVGRNLGLRSAW